MSIQIEDSHNQKTVARLIAAAQEKKRRVRIKMADLLDSEVRIPSRGPGLPNGKRCSRWEFYQRARTNHADLARRTTKLIATVLKAEKGKSCRPVRDGQSLFDKMVRINYPDLWSKVPFWDKKGGGQSVVFACDDASGMLGALVGPAGVIHLSLDPHPMAKQVGHFGPPSVRIRTWAGGGQSVRVHRAALLLMLAIVEDCPDTMEKLKQRIQNAEA